MTTMTKAHTVDTSGWDVYPFESHGVKFLSKIAPDSSISAKIKSLPEGVFADMNKSAVADLLSDFETMEELINGLARVNAGASYAVIELAGE